MKRLMYGILLAFTFAFVFAPVIPQPTQVVQAQECTKIKDGTITDTLGNTITLGYDQFGYNYQAHMFNGTFDSSDRVLDEKYFGQTVDYADDSLIMKWSDEWISNQDCDGDHKLDRGNGTGTSMGWLTNLVEGDYANGDDFSHYTSFTKIVYDPQCTSSLNGCLWNVYTIIEDVYNDPDGGHTGVTRDMLVRPAGFGFYTN